MDMIIATLARKSAGPEKIGSTADESPVHWHMAGPDQVLKHFQVSTTTGLSKETALRRLMTSGTNALPAMLPRSFPEILAAQVKSMPVLLILAAAGLSVLTGGVAEGVIAMSVAINQLLYALACRDGNEEAEDSRATGPLLRLTLWGTVGGYFALTLFRGFGGFVDALALGASALLSRALAKCLSWHS
jgi:magnesium-transporting ATPase (P-type)